MQSLQPPGRPRNSRPQCAGWAHHDNAVVYQIVLAVIGAHEVHAEELCHAFDLLHAAAQANHALVELLAVVFDLLC